MFKTLAIAAGAAMLLAPAAGFAAEVGVRSTQGYSHRNTYNGVTSIDSVTNSQFNTDAVGAAMSLEAESFRVQGANLQLLPGEVEMYSGSVFGDAGDITVEGDLIDDLEVIGVYSDPDQGETDGNQYEVSGGDLNGGGQDLYTDGGQGGNDVYADNGVDRTEGGAVGLNLFESEANGGKSSGTGGDANVSQSGGGVGQTLNNDSVNILQQNGGTQNVDTNIELNAAGEKGWGESLNVQLPGLRLDSAEGPLFLDGKVRTSGSAYIYNNSGNTRTNFSETSNFDDNSGSTFSELSTFAR